MNAILVRPIKPGILTDGGRQAPAFEVILAGTFRNADFPAGAVTLKLFARDFDPDGNQHQNPDEELATITGVVQRMSTNLQNEKYFHFTLNSIQSNQARLWNDAQAGIDADDPTQRFPGVGFAFSSDKDKAALKWFRLPRARSAFRFAAQPAPSPMYFEGDTWELELRLTLPGPANALRSPVFAVGWNPRVVPNRFVQEPTATYDWHAGNDVKFYNDANVDAPGNTGYFHDVQAAILAARKLVFIVDWSFHPEARLTPGDETLQNCLGARLINQASTGQVTIAILTWWHGFAPKDPPNDLCPSALDEMAATLGIGPNNVLWRGAVRKGIGLSHHQKFVVVDDGAVAPARARLKVFYGGIDLTQGRSDWPDHPILRDDPNCANFLNTLQNGGTDWGNHGPYDDWYNAEFASEDYGLPAADPAKTIVSATGNPAIVRMLNHGFQAGDVIYISGAPEDPAIEGDRVVVEATGNNAYKADHFVIAELDGTPIASNGRHPGGANVTRNMPRFPRQPWHDVHARLDGPIAWDFAREFAGRWMRVVGSPDADEGDASDAGKDRVWNAFYNLFDRTAFVQQWEDHVRAADEPVPGAPPAQAPAAPARNPIFAGQLLHSFPSEHFGAPKLNDRWHPARQEMKWLLSESYDRSIQDSYIKAILQAERFIYIENQYFIGSGSKLNPTRDGVRNRVPEALVSRILEMIAANQKFHVYAILPQIPEGPAVYGAKNPLPAVRNLEWRTIAYMIKSIKAAHANWWEYLSFYFLLKNDLPGNSGPFLPNPAIKDEAIRRTAHVIRNQRYMIYVHCKLMIVDDRYLILGSANINERSMAGDRDTEICVALWPGSTRTQVACETAIQGLRQSLLVEHTGNNVPASPNQPHSDGFRNDLQTLAQNNYAGLLSAPPVVGVPAQRLTGHLVMFPFEVAANGRDWAKPAWAPANNLNQYITDSINNGNDAHDRRHVEDFKNKYWTWQSNVPWCCSLLPDKVIE